MRLAGVAQWQSSWFVISRLLVRLRSPAPQVRRTPADFIFGGFPERPKGADCKSVVTDFGGPNPPSPTNKKDQALRLVFFVAARIDGWGLARKNATTYKIFFPFYPFLPEESACDFLEWSHESTIPHQKKALAKASAFFNETYQRAFPCVLKSTVFSGSPIYRDNALTSSTKHDIMCNRNPTSARETELWQKF